MCSKRWRPIWLYFFRCLRVAAELEPRQRLESTHACHFHAVACRGLADAMIVIVHWVLWAAPVGIFALVFALTARSGLGVLQALGIYVKMGAKGEANGNGAAGGG